MTYRGCRLTASLLFQHPYRSPANLVAQGYNPPMASLFYCKRFRLRTSIVAFMTANEITKIVRVPANEEVVLINRLDESDAPNRIVEVAWRDDTVKMSAGDLLERGEPI